MLRELTSRDFIFSGMCLHASVDIYLAVRFTRTKHDAYSHIFTLCLTMHTRHVHINVHRREGINTERGSKSFEQERKNCLKKNEHYKRRSGLELAARGYVNELVDQSVAELDSFCSCFYFCQNFRRR